MSYQHILLIDDDEDDQEIFMTAMERLSLSESVTCRVLSSAAEALKELESKQLVADLIFLDLNMPIMSGKEFLKHLTKSETLKVIPVIVLSTSSHLDTIKETKELGAKDFITKPDKFDQLVLILQSLIL
jgi:CheY-like chemotaxis protein